MNKRIFLSGIGLFVVSTAKAATTRIRAGSQIAYQAVIGKTSFQAVRSSGAVEMIDIGPSLRLDAIQGRTEINVDYTKIPSVPSTGGGSGFKAPILITFANSVYTHPSPLGVIQLFSSGILMSALTNAEYTPDYTVAGSTITALHPSLLDVSSKNILYTT